MNNLQWLPNGRLLKNSWLMVVLGAALANPAFGLDIMSANLLKGKVYSQTSAAAPALAAQKPYVFHVEAQPILVGWVQNAAIKPPSGIARNLAVVNDEYFLYEDQLDTAVLFNASYGPGTYQLNYKGQNDGQAALPFTIGADAFPAAPQVLNYSPAQAIDAAADFTLNWTQLSTLPNNFVDLQILDSGGSVVFNSVPISELEPWPGNTTSATIDADTLLPGASYVGVLRFYNLTTRDLTSLPMVSAGFYSETRFPLKTQGTASGDTTPPQLANNYPANGATITNLQVAPIMFSFSEPMQPLNAITWSANLDPAKFAYQWQGNSTLICLYSAALPGNATITWTLNSDASNPQNFRDVAGNQLAKVSGQFATGAGGSTTNNPCGPTNQVDAAAHSIFKSANFWQKDAATTVDDSTNGFLFMTFVKAPAGLTVTSGSVIAPGPKTKALQQMLPGSFSYMQQFTSFNDLELEFQPGNYQVQATTSAGNLSGLVVLPANGYPQTPHFLNLGALQAIDPTADFLLTWDAFANAASMDGILLEIVDENEGVVFMLPDPCKGKELAVNATSATVPKGTLKAGINYTLQITFSKVVYQGAGMFPSAPNQQGFGMLSKTTRTAIKTAGGTQLADPKFTSIKARLLNTIQFDLQCNAGRPLVIETTTGLAGSGTVWTTLISTNANSSSVSIVLPFTNPAAKAFFRAKQN